MLDTKQKNIATFIHLSTFSRFIFPFGNFIAPVVLWIANKDKSAFVDSHGKQAINFQISMLLYAVMVGIVTVPIFIFNILNGFEFVDFKNFEAFRFNIENPSTVLFGVIGLVIIAILGFILELIFVVIASLKARDGQLYKYPFTINFIK